MDSDDLPSGRVLSRREVMQVIGAAGVTLFAGPCNYVNRSASATQLPPCVVRPEQTEGPFFVDLELNRSDIRTEPSTGALVAGVPLQLIFQVSRIGSQECAPLPDARVDIWQCDADGRYSAFTDRSAGGDLSSQKFLRGYQLTDDHGMVRFTTIYPGWYRGRAVHIHFKIRTEAEQGKAYEFTSQLYFDDALTDKVHAEAPYAARGMRSTQNTRDGIFRRTGNQLMLAPTRVDAGYEATFRIGLDLSDADAGRKDGPRRSRRSG